MIIQDGKGSGRLALVNAEGHLGSQAQTIPLAAYHALVHEALWGATFDEIDPTGADDIFVYLRNDSATDLIVADLVVFSTVAGTLELVYVTGTAVGGTAATPGNRTLGSQKAVDATYQTGVDITGLTTVRIVEFVELVAATPQRISFVNAPIVLQQNAAIALNWTEATGILSGIIVVTPRILTADQ